MPNKDNLKKLKLLFIGDSLIEYFDWPARFPEYEVCSLGISGETVEGLYSRLKSIFRKADLCDAVFIMSGINNMAMGDKGFINTYSEAIKEIRNAYPSAMIAVHSLLPVLFPFISNDDIRYMNSRLKRIAIDENIVYIDINSRFLDTEGMPESSCLLDDGVHVSDKGYSIWSDEVEKLISLVLSKK